MFMVGSLLILLVSIQAMQSRVLTYINRGITKHPGKGISWEAENRGEELVLLISNPLYVGFDLQIM
jgi:hypothetical protein